MMIEIKIDDRAIIDGLNGLRRAVSDLSAVMREIGGVMADAVERPFRTRPIRPPGKTGRRCPQSPSPDAGATPVCPAYAGIDLPQPRRYSGEISNLEGQGRR
jgi:phage gpG-like protein